ncbi:molybdopterin-dependent oxidoreductase [Aquipuribacter hungaricus]|uniref:Molybdopterin-dependent oxidoreductase n=1 Tax=Aquipuribacter hungaricus TaxID=545624 RepID=A0ABV7WJG7_9MICO
MRTARRRGVPRRVGNTALLAVLLVALLAGLGSWLVAVPAQRGVAVAHGAAGLAVLALVRCKAPVVRSGLRRARAGRWASVLLGVLTLLALLSGVLHSTGLLVWAPGGQRTMWWHVAAGLVLVPLLLWHARARWQRPRAEDLDRRLLLRAGGVVAAAGAGWLALETVTRRAGLPGAARRATGSYLQDLPQPTIWLADTVPARTSAQGWELLVRDGHGERVLGLADLASLPRTDVRAVIDCTSGWASEQEWSGVVLSDLVRAGGPGRSVVVTSVTGYSRRFAVEDLDGLLLADRMAGEPLLRQLGAPVRLVAPGLRGFWWVKWVASVEVEDAPSWWQPPLPLR